MRRPLRGAVRMRFVMVRSGSRSPVELGGAMKKLTLDLESLAVDSFQTVLDVGPRGTVRGQDDDNPTDSNPSLCRTCEGDPTCYTMNCC